MNGDRARRPGIGTALVAGALGVTLGAIGGAIVGFAGGAFLGDSPAGTAAASPRAAVAPAAGAAGASAEAGTTALLHQEIERLRAELAGTRGAQAREVARAGEPAGGSGARDEAELRAAALEIVLPPTPPGFDELLAELERVIGSGLLTERFRRDPSELPGFLMYTWLQLGRPAEALALLARLPAEASDSELAGRIGDALEGLGDQAGAAQAYRLALAREPDDWDRLQALMRVAPEEALAEIEGYASEFGLEGDQGVAMQRAAALLAVGRSDEALAIFDRLLAANPNDEFLWSELMERAPAAAEERLRARMAGAAGEELAATRLRLAVALRGSGRQREAVELLGQALAEQPGDPAILERLVDLDPERGRRMLLEELERAPSAQLWAMLGENLLRDEALRAEATAAFWRAHELEPEGGWEYQLLRLAPAEIGPSLERRATAADDDELLGDIADAYWQIDRRDEAIALWERAHQIDRGDPEWTGKLRQARRGLNPFN
jgi:tetratricopeptide (TPR) repeat protein